MPSRYSAHLVVCSWLECQIQGQGESFLTPTRCGCAYQDSIRICASPYKRTIKRPAAETPVGGSRCRDMPDILPVRITVSGFAELAGGCRVSPSHVLSLLDPDVAVRQSLVKTRLMGSITSVGKEAAQILSETCSHSTKLESSWIPNSVTAAN